MNIDSPRARPGPRRRQPPDCGRGNRETFPSRFRCCRSVSLGARARWCVCVCLGVNGSCVVVSFAQRVTGHVRAGASSTGGQRVFAAPALVAVVVRLSAATPTPRGDEGERAGAAISLQTPTHLTGTLIVHSYTPQACVSLSVLAASRRRERQRGNSLLHSFPFRAPLLFGRTQTAPGGRRRARRSCPVCPQVRSRRRRAARA